MELLRELGALQPGTRRCGSPRSGVDSPACRSTRDWVGWCSRRRSRAAWPRSSSSRARCRSRTRASGRATSRRRRTRCTPGSPIPRATSSPSSGSGTTCASSSASAAATSSAACAGTSSCTTCACASGRTCTRSCARPARTSASRIGTPTAEPAAVHRALLAGLLSHIGSYDQARRDYLGARGARWAIHPGSALSRKPPAFAMAAELVETSRLFGRVAARVDPESVEAVAGDLVTRTYSEPRWSKKRVSVVADERVTLYGVPLVVGRRVQYGSIDPVVSRDLFIRHALVGGEWVTHHRFAAANERLVAEVAELEDRVRRRDLLVDDEALVDFFDERIPPDVTDGRAFDRWWKATRRDAPDLLTYPRELLLRGDDDLGDAFPRQWSFGSFDTELPLTYAFEPGAQHDGVTVDLPLALLPRARQDDFLWQVPGSPRRGRHGPAARPPQEPAHRVRPGPGHRESRSAPAGSGRAWPARRPRSRAHQAHRRRRALRRVGARVAAGAPARHAARRRRRGPRGGERQGRDGLADRAGARGAGDDRPRLELGGGAGPHRVPGRRRAAGGRGAPRGARRARRAGLAGARRHR